MGEGIEREVILQALSIHIAPNDALQPRWADLLVFTPPTDSVNVPSSPAELLRGYTIGALISLCVFRLGYVPPGVSEIFYLWALNSGDFSCITRAVMERFAPDFLLVLDAFSAAGHDGDLTPFREHFINYLGFDVSCLHTSNEIELTLRLYRSHKWPTGAQKLMQACITSWQDAP